MAIERRKLQGFQGLVKIEGGSESLIPDNALTDMNNMIINDDGTMELRKQVATLLEANGLETGTEIIGTGVKFDDPRGIAVRQTLRVKSATGEAATVEFEFVPTITPDVYVSETGKNRIIKFDKDQKFIKSVKTRYPLIYGSFTSLETDPMGKELIFSRELSVADPLTHRGDTVVSWDVDLESENFISPAAGDGIGLRAAVRYPVQEIYIYPESLIRYRPSVYRAETYEYMGDPEVSVVGGFVIFNDFSIGGPGGRYLQKNQSDYSALSDTRGIAIIGDTLVDGSNFAWMHVIVATASEILIWMVKSQNTITSGGDMNRSIAFSTTGPAASIASSGSSFRSIALSKVQIPATGRTTAYKIYVADAGTTKRVRVYQVNTGASAGSTPTISFVEDYTDATNLTAPYAIAYDIQNNYLYAANNVDTNGKILRTSGASPFSTTILYSTSEQTLLTGPMFFIDEIEGQWVFGDRYKIYAKPKNSSSKKDWNLIYNSSATANLIKSAKFQNNMIFARDGADDILVWDRRVAALPLSFTDKPVFTTGTVLASGDYAACYADFKQKSGEPDVVIQSGPWATFTISTTGNIDVPPVALDPRINHILVYKKNTINAEYEQHKIYKCAPGIRGNQRNGDNSQISQSGLLPPQDPAPRAKFVGVYKDTIILANSKEFPKRWWWSAKGISPLPFHYDLTYWYDELPDEIKGIWLARDFFLIFTNRRIIQVSGNPPIFSVSAGARSDLLGSISKEIITDQVGCDYPESITGDDSRVFFYGTDNVPYMMEWGTSVGAPRSLNLVPMLEIKGMTDTFPKTYVHWNYGDSKLHMVFSSYDPKVPTIYTDGYLSDHHILVYNIVSKKFYKYTHDPDIVGAVAIPIIAIIYDQETDKWIGGWSFRVSGASGSGNHPFEIVDIYSTVGTSDYEVGTFKGLFKTKRFNEDVRIHGIQFDIETPGNVPVSGSLFTVKLFLDGSTTASQTINVLAQAAQADSRIAMKKLLRFYPYMAKDWQIEVSNIVQNIKFKGIRELVVEPILISYAPTTTEVS